MQDRSGIDKLCPILFHCQLKMKILLIGMGSLLERNWNIFLFKKNIRTDIFSFYLHICNMTEIGKSHLISSYYQPYKWQRVKYSFLYLYFRWILQLLFYCCCIFCSCCSSSLNEIDSSIEMVFSIQIISNLCHQH